VLAGVVGQADVSTEPPPWIKAQNMLSQTDAEESEGSGFAFTSARLGVLWLIVRGISDSMWHPNAYHGVVASNHCAVVVLVDHLPARISSRLDLLVPMYENQPALGCRSVWRSE
jgi:adenosylhomocysteine nucleosidase